MSQFNVSDLGDYGMPLWSKTYETLDNALIVIDPPSKKVFAVTQDGFYTNRAHVTIPIDPCVDGDDLMSTLQSAEARELIDRIFEGYDQTWDDNSCSWTGVLDEDATDAKESLESLLDECETLTAVEDIDDWDFEDAWPSQMTLNEAADVLIDKIDERKGYSWEGNMKKELLQAAELAYENGEELSETQLQALGVSDQAGPSA